MSDATSRYLEGEYLARNPGWHVEDSAWKARHIADILRANDVAPRTVAEVGCGAGAVLAELRALMPDATFEGFDISPQAIELARGRAADGLRFHLGSPDERGEPFDVMLLIDVVEHVEDLFGMLRRMRARARHHVFHIPLDLSAQAVLRGQLLRRREAVGHVHYFTRETALATLRDTGYEIVDWRYTAGTLELPVQSTLARLAKLPRRLLFRARPDAAVRALGGFSLLVLTR